MLVDIIISIIILLILLLLFLDCKYVIIVKNKVKYLEDFLYYIKKVVI